MKSTSSFKNSTVEIICLLYILLFVYAAVSKLLDFENFQVQIAQSPLLSSFAGPLSWLVPTVELVISISLLTTNYRLIALYAGFCLMVMFSCYIVIILKFSLFIPCSCGGVLEKLNWTQHLIFNIIYCLLALPALFFMEGYKRKQPPKSTLLKITGLLVLGTGVVTTLFLASENMIRYHNNFVRRFPHHPAVLDTVMDLNYNSYYIAGEGSGYVFLGNKTAPLNVLLVDSALQTRKEYKILLPEGNFPLRSPRLIVRPPYFYLWDGAAPLVFRGAISDWHATLWDHNTAYFNAFEPITNNKAVVRAISSERNENVLGILSVDSVSRIRLFPVLKRQLDGIFDTHGTLLYNAQRQKIIYTYSFRNEYMIWDQQFLKQSALHTIDTFSKARIKVKHIASKKATNLASPGYVVNSLARTYRNYLFVKSEIMGKYETKEMWDEATIIDVYDIDSHTYRFSFYLTDIKNLKMSDFVINDNKAFVLTGRYLSSFKLTENFYSN